MTDHIAPRAHARDAEHLEDLSRHQGAQRRQAQGLGGEVLALMGENGAGKIDADEDPLGRLSAGPGGEILIDGVPVADHRSHRTPSSSGISIIYQELSLAPNLTVAENIYLGNEPRAARP